MKKLIKHILILLFLSCCSVHLVSLYAQNINIEEVMNFKKKKFLKVNGSLSASSGYFTSTPQQERQPFTYQLNGLVNLSIYELINIPVSFNLNNYGSKFSYPSLPNRLSLHPSYKWVRAHIGDISMSFSPYTLNGHMFTGAAFELTPNKWQISVMGGRLLKAVSYDTTRRNVMPNYNRWGYGVKTRYNAEKFFAGLTIFSAKDIVKQPSFQMDSLGIHPKSNVALAVEGGISLIKNLSLTFDYGMSVLTRDTRAPKDYNSLFFEKLSGGLTTTSIYHAIKTDITYTIKNSNIGVGYERISPDYETLGAYYFNNDYQNITLNFSSNIFNNKLAISASGGVQNDDLQGDKAEKNSRFVGSINLNYTPSERFYASFSASSFQGHRNIKSNFDYINAQSPYDNLDTLNFTQISNSMDINTNWNVIKTEAQAHNITVSVNYQEAGDRQGEYILPGNLTRYINFSSGYGIDFKNINLSTNLGVNVSNNYSSMKNMLTYGPILSLYKRFFEQKVTTGIALSWNQTKDDVQVISSITNLRWNASYRFLKKHCLTASLGSQFRRLVTMERKRNNSFNLQINYNYSF